MLDLLYFSLYLYRLDPRGILKHLCGVTIGQPILVSCLCAEVLCHETPFVFSCLGRDISICTQ